MSLSATWRKERRIFSPIWLWVTAVVAVTTTTVKATVKLHPHSPECVVEGNTTVRCDLADNNSTEYTLNSFQWLNIRKVIIRDATHLELKYPLCSAYKRLVEIYNSARVTTEQGAENCGQQLFLQNCRDVSLENGVNFVQMVSSEARKIILSRVSRFHLQDSRVREVSVAVDRDKTTVTNSMIEVVMKMVINGSVKLNMEDSTLGQVEGFVYDSTQSATLKNVTTESVASNGFVVQNGVLTLDNFIISSVASNGLLVLNGAKLTLEDCEIEAVVYDSIMVSEGGKIYLKNVTIGQHREIFITLLDVSMPLYPLAFVYKSSLSMVGWVAIAVFVGMTAGAITGVAVMMFVMRRREASRSNVDITELQTLEHSTSQGAVNLNTYKHIGKFTSNQLGGSPGKLPKADEVQYVEAPQAPPTKQGPKQAQRPPVPLLHESSSLSVKDHTLGKPNTLTAPLKDSKFQTTGKDKQYVLPLPPPPPSPPSDEDEELYDEVQGSAIVGVNLRDITANMPKLPPKNKVFP